MRTKFYLNGKKATKKAATDRVGEEELQSMIEKAKKAFSMEFLMTSGCTVQVCLPIDDDDTLTIEFAA